MTTDAVPALDDDDSDQAPVDLRMPALGAAAWIGGLVGLLAPVPLAVGLIVAGAAGVLMGRLRGRDVRLPAGLLVVAAVVGAGAALRVDVVAHGPVSELAERSAFVHARLTVTSDPVVREGRFSTYAVFRADVVRVTGRGRTFRTRAPVTVVADPDWGRVRLGSTLDVTGTLAPSDDDDVAGLLHPHGDPSLVAGPGPVWVASATLRRAVREAVAGRPLEPRTLVPALVDGDDAGMPEETAEEFRVTGLTHLLAVSGTNLTLVVGFLLSAARWCRVRGRWLLLVGAVGIVAFVVIARTEPSVLRAAAMGTVGLVALGANGRQRGSRALGAAVLLLLLVDPWLATSVGFALSVLATAGILFLAPGWRDALSAWLPRVVAEAVAVPLAAQVACTPVIAAISGQVSLVAVAANLVAAPAVGPATILGLLGGVVGLVVPPLGRALGWGASWFAAWIIEVASRGARLPTAAIGWGTGPLAIALLTVGCLGLVLVLPAVLRRPRAGAGCCALLAVVVLVPMPTPGWPPRDWVLVACDVGQGDGLVLNTGDGRAVVIDTGPEPSLMDHCLDQLGIDTVPLVVLTHFHADHVDGLAGVLEGRRVGEIDVTGRADPAEQADLVLRTAAGYQLRVPEYGETRVIGDLTLQVLAPVPGTLTHEEVSGGEGSGPNNASIVLLVEVAGIRLLLTGDVEPDAQRAIARAWPGLSVDVLKVPHHGSSRQYLPWLLGLGARLAVVSVGVDNDYGHPSADTLGPLQAAGLRIYRTDQDGNVAVSVVDSEIRVATHG
jgi:competence protein ComEC